MQEKKGISNNKVIVSIKDGYNLGDKLDLHTKDLSYSWNADSQSLEVQADDTLDLSGLIKQVYLEGVGGVDRFLDASFINEEGEKISLKEFEVSPTYTDANLQMNNQVAQVSHHMLLQSDSPTTLHTGNILDDNSVVVSLSDINYEELAGADFLSYENEEKLAFQVENRDNGDSVYKLLKDALFEQKAVELWGYDFSNDKLDLTEIAKSYTNMEDLSFALSKHNEDVMLSIADSKNEYSVVFKEVSENVSNDKLDEVLNALILDAFNVKVGS